MKPHRLSVALTAVCLGMALLTGPALAKKEASRFGIEGKFLSYDQESQTFKIYVTSNRSVGFGGSIAGAKAPSDVKPRKEMTLSVKPTGSVLSRTVIKSVTGTGLDISGTQEGFSRAVKAIPRDYRVTFSITRNPETRSNPDQPAYHVNTVIIQLNPEELEERWRKFSEGED